MISKRENAPANQATAATTQKQTFLFGEYSFETGENILWRDEKIVSLPPKTCELLAAFIENAGRLLTKEELMNTVWAGTFVEEANLSHHIAVLRKALVGENKNGKVFIETVPRKGYRFVLPVTPKNNLEIVVTERTETRVIEEEIEAPDNLLIGRERELSVIKNLLRRKDAPLLSLTGVGGAGKTSLAQTVLKEMSGASATAATEFADGGAFVDLSAVTSPALVVSTIAQSLGIRSADTVEDLIEKIKNHLSEREMLLVLDNFEQVIEAAPQIAKMASSGGKSKILVTSRARLHLRSEREFQVPPLELPSKEKLPEEIIECSAVRLFVERARAARPNFNLTDENAAAIAEICRRLEGLPLAIELAAPRLRLLSPEQILQRLQSQLNLLTGGAQDVPARQKTIRGAIAWSYDLLDENEKRVFESLAVFAGGFSLEAAEAVAGNRKNVDAAGKFSDSSKSFETLDVIESLVDKNLLQLLEPSQNTGSEAGDEKPRFRFLEAIREFALERLEASGESERLRSRHAEYFLALAEQGEVERRMRDGESGWTQNFRIEKDNLRAALTFLLQSDAEKALRLVTDLHIFWSYNFQLEEGRRLLAEALRISKDEPSALRGRAYKGAAMLAWKQGDYEEARRLYGETHRIAESRGDKNLIAIAKNGLGIAAYQQNDLSAAKNFFEDALDLARQSDDEILAQSILTGLGEIARIEEDYEAVRRYNSEVEEFARRNGYKNHLCGSLINLGALACEENDCKTARQYFMEAAQIASELKQDVLLTLCFVGFAAVAAEDGDAVRAALLTGAADNLCSKIGYTLETPDRIFREKYLSRLRGLLSEKDLTELIARGRAINAYEALALVAAN